MSFNGITDIMKIMAASRDPDELKYYWIEWHNAIGKGIRPLFPRYVRLFREAAALNSKYTVTVNAFSSFHETSIIKVLGE